LAVQRDHVPTHPDTPKDDAAQRVFHTRLASEIGQNEEGDQRMFRTNPPRSAGPCGLCQEGLVDLLTPDQQRNAHGTPQQSHEQILGGTEERVREMS
jgi:hypothetical protein